MSTIVTRAGKGSALTWTEGDNNITNLNNDKLQNVVEDTTPQLGGSLDVNGQSIVSVSNGDIAITPNGTGKVVLDGLNWPTADGSADQVLKTNGSGQLSFATAGGGAPSFAILQNNNSAEYTANHSSITHPAAWTEILDTNGIVSISTHDFTVGAGTYAFHYIHNKNLRFNCQASGSQITYPTLNWFFYDVTNNANRIQLDFDGMKDRGFTNGDYISQYLGPLTFYRILTVTNSTTYRMRTSFDVGGGTSSAAINLSGGTNERGQLIITKLA